MVGNVDNCIDCVTDKKLYADLLVVSYDQRSLLC